jgi:transposase
MRARGILLWADGKSVEETMESLGWSRIAVYQWRERFQRQGLEGLQTRPGSGRPRIARSETIDRILNLTTERILKGSIHWSVRLMAKYARTTTCQVRQVWEAADLKPHPLRSFKISNDPLFAGKVIDVVGVYMQPPEGNMVLSVNEKSQIQALDRTQPMLPFGRGREETRTLDYRRYGTTDLFAAFDIATGEVIGRLSDRHRAREFLEFLRQVDKTIAPEPEVHVILDNSSSHKTPEVRSWLKANPRYHFHFTPTNASWLNALEGWFSLLERRSLHRGTFFSVKALRAEIRRYIEAHNGESAKPFVWTKSAEAIIAAVDKAREALQSTSD